MSETLTLEQVIDEEAFTASGDVESGAFVGIWRTYDAQKQLRTEVDLTGEPCPNPAQLKQALAAAFFKRLVPQMKVPEVEKASAIEWEKLEGATKPHADKIFPLYLKALASREPILRRRALYEIAITVAEQDSVGEATPVALPFLVRLLEGTSADKIGRGHVLTLLSQIASYSAYAEAPDDIFKAAQTALREQLPRLKELAPKISDTERIRLQDIIADVEKI